MCSPSRSNLFTGYFPAQHGVTDTLSFGSRFSLAERVLPRELPNIATVFAAAGYDVAYKGKWHLSKPLRDPDDPRVWTPADVATYGFDRWDPPDAARTGTSAGGEGCKGCKGYERRARGSGGGPNG
jgi:arylsulfatase A-like enzyme